MEAAASSLSTLLSTLRVNGPWTPPGTWESVIPESGAARVSHLGGRPRLQPIYELASVTDDALIHLALHALYGVKTSLDEIEELSALSSSNPADRTSNRVPNVWLRSSSTTSMGSILKSFRSTGLAVFFLCKFVHFYLFQSREMNCASREVHEHEDSGDKDTKQHQPYTLVNQAFAAAVNKVLEGYFCSLNTLLASIRLRRSVGQSGIASKISNGMSCDPTSEVTLLEVYLHTEELRRHVKSLGNICFPKFAGLTLCQEGLNTDANVEFENFPRGTDLLSYLYVHIRDADPVHYGLLKYLFIRSCEPYFNFIKSWIYRASVDDPYEEFLITQTENKGAQGISSDITDDFILFPLKGRNHVSAPCFLKEICHPLLRTGQQLQVLMNLLKYCNLAATEGDVYPSRNIIHMEGVLPWFDTPIESSMNSFTFSKSAIEALTCKRDAMYKLMMEKLQHFFSNVEVIAFDTASNFLHKRTDLVDASVSDAELFYGDSDAVLPCNMAADEKDDSSSNSQESSDKEDPLESSECSSYTSMDDTEVESSTACENLSSSMFSLYCTSTGEAKGSLVTSKLLSSQSSSVDHGINCAIPIECEKDDRLSCKHVLVHPQNTKHTAVPDGSELDYQYSQFSPFDRFMKRASCSFESMNSVGEFLYSDHKRSVGNAVYPLHSESGSTKLSNSKNYEKFVTINQPWNTSIPYNLSLNPILKNAACYHTESDMQQKSKNQSLASFDFESVMDPCEVYCARSPSLLVESVNGAATAGQPSTQPYEQPDCSTKLLQAQTRSQSSLTSSGEMSTGDSLQKNASGGAFWEISLLYNDKSKEKPAMDFSSQFDMPLDIVIDKCIIQEILLQYKYVSSFTMKLLEEGFDLCAHLLALRRYHFMEIADWADSFIASIYQKKWSFVKSEQKRSEIQGLMDLALQRSSCDSDPYKERLFIYMRESPVDSVDASPCGLDLLDDILLGYKAEWPMNIVITVDALKIYAEIFCYLLQVRFAVFSLTEVWRFLKELTQFIGRSSHSRSDVLKKLNFVMKLRYSHHESF
ncbi:Spc97 / Spc98 family of spindle pole body (SBP) component [Zea mays]|uniref:Gamma-tubulin complex component n=2 Tax=Zea mays TaxID=4577 RepID=A0A1D6E2P1_MAIZE|nr:Spc97 / Spc98 family of spindle pole body (SBP) component [Zea mays]